jgi:hypothetical protein
MMRLSFVIIRRHHRRVIEWEARGGRNDQSPAACILSPLQRHLAAILVTRHWIPFHDASIKANKLK